MVIPHRRMSAHSFHSLSLPLFPQLIVDCIVQSLRRFHHFHARTSPYPFRYLLTSCVASIKRLGGSGKLWVTKTEIFYWIFSISDFPCLPLSHDIFHFSFMSLTSIIPPLFLAVLRALLHRDDVRRVGQHGPWGVRRLLLGASPAARILAVQPPHVRGAPGDLIKEAKSSSKTG